MKFPDAKTVASCVPAGLKTAEQGYSDQCTGDRGRIRDREPTCLRFRRSPTHPGREHVQTDEYKKYNRKQKGTMRTSP